VNANVFVIPTHERREAGEICFFPTGNLPLPEFACVDKTLKNRQRLRLASGDLSKYLLTRSSREGKVL
jgi:hypothetical protein